jgi:hypothetical protein
MRKEMLDAKQEKKEAREMLAETNEVGELKQALQHAEERARLAEKQLKAKQQLERIKKEKEANSDLLHKFKKAKVFAAYYTSSNTVHDSPLASSTAISPLGNPANSVRGGGRGGRGLQGAAGIERGQSARDRAAESPVEHG